MAGGDGSQALVASVAARHGLAYVCVPAGTRNHFALDLGLDRADVVGALDAFADGLQRWIDLAEVNGRTFVNNASLGLYAEVVQAPEYRDAKLRTAAAHAAGPARPGRPAARPVLHRAGRGGGAHRPPDPGLQQPLPAGPAGGGVGTRERMDRGVLGLVTVTITDAAQASALPGAPGGGQARRFSGWAEWTGPRFEVRSAAPVAVGVDGEALVLDPPLVFTSARARCGSGCPAGPCGARPRPGPCGSCPRSTVAGLARVAAGVARG